MIRECRDPGAEVDTAACEAAGIQTLMLPETHRDPSQTMDEDQVVNFANLCRETQGAVAVCSNDHSATGTMLGVALLAEGLPVQGAIETMAADVPTNIDSMGQMEFLYAAAGMLGIELDL